MKDISSVISPLKSHIQQLLKTTSKKTSKIALLHFSAPPIIAGVESLMRSHAIQFKKRGYEVEIITGEGKAFENIPMKIIPLMSARNQTIKQIQQELSKGNIPSNFESTKKQLLVELKQNITADILIIHNVMTIPYNLALTCALSDYIEESDKKIVYWHHDHGWSNEIFKNFIIDKYPWNIVTKHSPKIHYVSISKTRSKDLVKYSGVKEKDITIIPNGLNVDKFLDLTPPVLKVMQEYNLLDGAINILMPIRIVEKKNIELAVKMLAELLKLTPARIIISGPIEKRDVHISDYFEKLIKLITDLKINDRIIMQMNFGTFLDDDSIRCLYRLCDLVFLSSFPEAEGFGFPIIEAEMSNKLVITSDINVFKEVNPIKGNFFGLYENPKEIAKKVLEIWSKDISSQAFKHSLLNYSLNKIFESKILPFLSSL